jgi:hypothetical protein
VKKAHSSLGVAWCFASGGQGLIVDEFDEASESAITFVKTVPLGKRADCENFPKLSPDGGLKIANIVVLEVGSAVSGQDYFIPGVQHAGVAKVVNPHHPCVVSVLSTLVGI